MYRIGAADANINLTYLSWRAATPDERSASVCAEGEGATAGEWGRAGVGATALDRCSDDA